MLEGIDYFLQMVKIILTCLGLALLRKAIVSFGYATYVNVRPPSREKIQKLKIKVSGK